MAGRVAHTAPPPVVFYAATFGMLVRWTYAPEFGMFVWHCSAASVNISYSHSAVWSLQRGRCSWHSPSEYLHPARTKMSSQHAVCADTCVSCYRGAGEHASQEVRMRVAWECVCVCVSCHRGGSGTRISGSEEEREESCMVVCFTPPGGWRGCSGSRTSGSEEEAGAGGARTSGSDEEGNVEAPPSTGRANACVSCHRGAAGHAPQEVRRRPVPAGHASQEVRGRVDSPTEHRTSEYVRGGRISGSEEEASVGGTRISGTHPRT